MLRLRAVHLEPSEQRKELKRLHSSGLPVDNNGESVDSILQPTVVKYRTRRARFDLKRMLFLLRKAIFRAAHRFNITSHLRSYTFSCKFLSTCYTYDP